MSSNSLELTPQLRSYLLDACREPETFQQLRAETAELPNASMQISPEQGRLMMLLVELIGCRRALEIGTFTGYSALCVATAMPSDGRLIACDLSEEWTAIARRFWKLAGVAEKIDLRIGPALNTLDELLAGDARESLDFAFIDADKANYASYSERVLALLRPGGLIAIDNAFWSGRVADANVNDESTVAIRELNRALCDDPRVTTSLVPIGDGLLLARKR